MPKALVETNGDYQLYDMFGGPQCARADRPSVVELTNFMRNHIGTRLTILEPLADDASDAPLAAAATPEELEAAIADLPRADAAPKAAPKAKK